MDSNLLKNIIDGRSKEFEEMSDAIWGYAELCFNEYKSSKLQMDFLKKEGFEITNPIGKLDTAFIAQWGQGAPIIGILGEYDALEGLSQQSDMTEKAPIIPKGSGHGCGHQLLGTAGVEAVCALKKIMEDNQLKGTIRYYGCPAEEGGAGKVLMIKEGSFKDLDTAISWHPGGGIGLFNGTLACLNVSFRFKGTAAHAGVQPERGRNSLFAVELMNTGVHYMREEIPQHIRIHYAVTNSGGDAANIVQSEAEVLYCIRAKTQGELLEIYNWICDIAKGAAMMTQTTCEKPKVISAYSNFINNDTLADIMIEQEMTYIPEYTNEEIEYAKKFKAVGAPPRSPKAINNDVNPDKHKPAYACSDFADVSWVVPSMGAGCVTFAEGTIMHNWLAVAQGKSSVAHKGMHTAAKIMAGTALELFKDPSLVATAKEDYIKELNGQAYYNFMDDGE